MRRRRDGRPWLNRLECLLRLEGPEAFVAVLFHTVDDALLAAGMDGQDAFRIALRCCRLVLFLLDGFEQREAAAHLGVSERTAKMDARRLRCAIESGQLTRVRFMPFRPLPRRPEDPPPSQRSRRPR